MAEAIFVGDNVEASMHRPPRSREGILVGGTFVANMRKKGSTKIAWSDTFHNVVVSEGLEHILDCVLTGGTQVTTWYIGLKGTTGIDTGDQISTHSFTEVTAYDESTRPVFTEARSGVSVSNSANKSTFTIDADGTTIEGAFLASSKSAGGSAGVLLCAADFTGGTKVGDSGDKLEVTYTFTAADA